MRYRVAVTILSATGWQVYSTEADSPAESLAKFKKCDCDFVDEEVEVTNLDFENIELSEIEKE